MSKYPRVLVISHNSFSSTSNMGQTLETFFNGWPTDSIAQIYIYNELPESRICNTFYRVTDSEMVRNIITRKKIGGKVNSNLYGKNVITNRRHGKIGSIIYKMGSKRLILMDFFRELIWKYGNWLNEDLSSFIEEFRPDVIFLAPANYRFIYNISTTISNKYDIPIATFFADDYYTYHKKSINPLYYLIKKKLRYTIKEIVRKSNYLYAVSDVMKYEYEKIFGKSFDLLLTGISKINSKISNNFQYPISIVYAGNLGLKRWEVISVLSKEIESINSNGHIYSLDIYSSTNLSKSTLRKMVCGNYTKFKGSVSAKELSEILNRSDVLLHVESFEKSIRKRTKMSISTKISNYLGLGKVILAIGPQEIGSIQHVLNNNAGVVVTDYKDLRKKLVEISIDKDNNDLVSKNALTLANNRHNILKISDLVRKTLFKAKQKVEG